MNNKISKLDHLNITVANFTESVTWYEDILNFKLVESGFGETGNKWGVVRSGDTMIVLCERAELTHDPDEKYHRVNHFGLRLVDSKELINKIKKFKLETYYNSPVTYVNSTSWYIKDPTGHEIEISIWKNNKVTFN